VEEEVWVLLELAHWPRLQRQLDVDASVSVAPRVEVHHAVELVVAAAAHALRASEAEVDVVDLEPRRASDGDAVGAGVAVVEELRGRLVLLQPPGDRGGVVLGDGLLQQARGQLGWAAEEHPGRNAGEDGLDEVAEVGRGERRVEAGAAVGEDGEGGDVGGAEGAGAGDGAPDVGGEGLEGGEGLIGLDAGDGGRGEGEDAGHQRHLGSVGVRLLVGLRRRREVQLDADGARKGAVVQRRQRRLSTSTTVAAELGPGGHEVPGGGAVQHRVVEGAAHSEAVGELSELHHKLGKTIALNCVISSLIYTTSLLF
jgi:hypothetical protein